MSRPNLSNLFYFLLSLLPLASLVAGVSTPDDRPSQVPSRPSPDDLLALAHRVCAAWRCIETSFPSLLNDTGSSSYRSLFSPGPLFKELVEYAQPVCAGLLSNNTASTSPVELAHVPNSTVTDAKVNQTVSKVSQTVPRGWRKALEQIVALYTNLVKDSPRDPKWPKRVTDIELVNHGGAGERLHVLSPDYGVETPRPVTGRIYLVPRMNGTCSCIRGQWTPVIDRIVVLEHRVECDAAKRVKCAKDYQAQAVLFYSSPKEKSLLDADQQKSLNEQNREDLLPVGVISSKNARKLADQERRLWSYATIQLIVKTD
ncbi:hypothetical protein L249_6681 [Ophiocordyceps polyrhachis-furcata BCC 54312]|uniref:PA domain-containing protein n=1 Tax=Ophiocordyceps polyrhachis-furcata BCC 54312 TaxID=1330021 RepID=A0A367LJZ4_9HYPO|nr:hypothetical protein L249_6681 [Ophiocordyceps polyrhachis-furcata BCC 54312]